jgi:hypothetical protein
MADDTNGGGTAIDGTRGLVGHRPACAAGQRPPSNPARS